MKQAFVSEIYASVQGEGPFAGEPQIFLRLAGCPLRCHYCDTPDSLTAQGHGRTSVDEVLRKALQLRAKKNIRTISVTGGEPLAQVSFLEELLPQLHQKKFRVYLETAGVHPRALQRVVTHCDVIAMDMKMPSAVGREWWAEHKKFLKISGAKAFVKIVVDTKTKLSEIKKALQVIRSTALKPLLVFQPATTIPSRTKAPSITQLSEAYLAASRVLPKVFVMPQQHKFWGVR